MYKKNTHTSRLLLPDGLERGGEDGVGHRVAPVVKVRALVQVRVERVVPGRGLAVDCWCPHAGQVVLAEQGHVGADERLLDLLGSVANVKHLSTK